MKIAQNGILITALFFTSSVNSWASDQSKNFGPAPSCPKILTKDLRTINDSFKAAVGGFASPKVTLAGVEWTIPDINRSDILRVVGTQPTTASLFVLNEEGTWSCKYTVRRQGDHKDSEFMIQIPALKEEK
jgi:hypothetical protein